ncbi:hypothetical protein GQR58_001637 [Nymphon striatum]|nr:hypothetical protein GQR58_001637 [Nymphon striatum]
MLRMFTNGLTNVTNALTNVTNALTNVTNALTNVTNALTNVTNVLQSYQWLTNAYENRRRWRMSCERSEFVTNAYEDTANVAKFERFENEIDHIPYHIWSKMPEEMKITLTFNKIPFIPNEAAMKQIFDRKISIKLLVDDLAGVERIPSS